MTTIKAMQIQTVIYFTMFVDEGFRILIIEESLPHKDEPIILKGDPSYFPNAYLGKNKYTFLIKDKNRAKCYRKFSSKLKISIK